MSTRRRLVGPARPIVEGDRATPFELFFDLVFVYAITQVTELMATKLDPAGIAQGMLALAILWWCWCGYTWLGNTTRLDEGLARNGMFAVMGVMFVVALTIPEAFHDMPRGLSGPLVFAICYFAVRMLHLALYWRAAEGDEGLRQQLLRAAIPMSGGTVFLFIAAFNEGWTQIALWAAAMVWDLSGTLLSGLSGWRVHSAAHFAERHGLIVIIAIGESLVAIGVGAHALAISWPILIGALLGMAVAAGMWWAYFDVVAVAAEHKLAQARGAHRAKLATYGYTYLHLVLVAGIILLALGLKKALQYAGGYQGHTPSDALHGLGLYALYGGVFLYLLGHAAFGRVMFGYWKKTRIAGFLLVAAAVPLANFLPALGALGLLAAIILGVLAYEVIKYSDARENIRHGNGTGHEQASVPQEG